MKVNKVVYSEYGYFGPFELYTVDLVEGYLELSTKENVDPTDQKTTRVSISAERIKQISAILDGLGIEKYQKHYEWPEVLDGTQWGLTAYFTDGQIVEVGGSNAWPENIGEFLDIFGEQEDEEDEDEWDL